MNKNPLYALDFDGVICHSAVETAITGWKAAQTLWPEMKPQSITEGNIQQFTTVRPCLEFGFEAIFIMRLIQQNVSMSSLCNGYNKQIKQAIETEGLELTALKELFGKTRDNQIKKNREEWVNNNPLFKGIKEKLKVLKQEDWVIVTTKQERFVKAILYANQIELSEDRIFGLDRKLNKQTVLTRLLKETPKRPITFIEDRLPTLLGVQRNPELQSVRLQLVDWGYNTERDQEIARSKTINVIDASEFLA